MKTQITKYNEYKICSGNTPKNIINRQTTAFVGNIVASKTPFIDKVLNNKLAQKSFKLADFSPHIFNLSIMGLIGVILRPASIFVVPGAKKEDKQYAMAKSIVGSVVVIASHLALCIPLAKAIKKLGVEAEAKPHLSNFPKINSPRFEAFNYFVNNGFAMFLTVALSMLTVKAITTIMNKILPTKNKKPKGNNFDVSKGEVSVQNTFTDVAKDKEHRKL